MNTPTQNTEHSPGALICAEIIMDGHAMIKTSYGHKRVEGIADLIENETGLHALLADNQRLREQVRQLTGYLTDAALQLERLTTRRPRLEQRNKATNNENHIRQAGNRGSL